ncbi:MAG: hypothetical protein ACJ72D_04175 [Marmoricola sp.]
MSEEPLYADPGIRFGIAHVVVIATLLVCGLFGVGGPESGTAALLAVGLYGAGLPSLLRPVMGVITWAFVTGFVVHDLGQLTFTHADLLRLLGFVVGVPVVAGARPRAHPRRGTLVP